jgi:hypothetical protein
MQKEPLIFMSALGLVGYITFHGHPFGQDCWMCNYRGLTFIISSVALGAYLACQEKD